MARGRMINQTIDLDPEFNALSIEGQLMYLRTLAFLDRDGLIIGHPRALLARVAPLLDFTQAHMLDIIDEWVEQKLVIRYTLKVGDILFFKGFSKNQSGMHYDRETPSRFPPPPGWTYGPKGLVPIESEPPPPLVDGSAQTESGDTPTVPVDDVQSESGLTPDEVLQESGETPATVANESAPIEVKVKDQIQEQQEEEEDTQARPREPVALSWWQEYGEAIPEHLVKPFENLVAERGIAAAIHGIKASAKADSRNFKYIAECARNYIPPAQNSHYTNGASSNGRYSVDTASASVPGVHVMQPTGNAPPLPPPMAHDDPWAVALQELTPQLTPTTASWLVGSTLEANGELAGVPFYRITVRTAPSNIGWLMQQAEPAIRKKVSSIVGKRIQLEIVAAESEPA